MVRVRWRCGRYIQCIAQSIQLEGQLLCGIEVYYFISTSLIHAYKSMIIQLSAIKIGVDAAIMHQKDMKDYLKFVTRFFYRIGWLQDGVKGFGRVGRILRFSLQNSGCPFFNIKLTWLVFSFSWTVNKLSQNYAQNLVYVIKRRGAY